MKITEYLIIGLLTICAAGTYVQGEQEVKPKRPVRGVRPRVTISPRAKERESLRLRSVQVKDDCPEGSVRFQDTCFKLSLVPKTWKAARLACRRILPRGDLASIHSKEELEFIQKTFGDGRTELIWIGLRKRYPGTPYRWANRDPVRYLPWAPTYTGHEASGFGALSLTKLHFVPKMRRTVSLPFLCGTSRVSSSYRDDPAVGADHPLQESKPTAETGNMIREDIADNMNTCREDWKRYNQKCYKAFDEKKSYEDAVTTCKKEGANLLILHNPEESKFMRQHVMVKDRPSGKYWLGLSNNAKGMQWPDGSPFDYSNWRRHVKITIRRSLVPLPPEEEENRNFLGRCFQIDWEDLTWDDEDCEDVGYFICNENGVANKVKPYITQTGATVPALDSSGINITLNEVFFTGEEKPALTDPESEDDDDQNTITISMIVVGCFLVVVAAFGAVSWHRQYRNVPLPWTSRQDSPRNKSHKLQLLKYPETCDVNLQGAYGTMK